jgi:tetratricopeptide (TPR) repeat protein
MQFEFRSHFRTYCFSAVCLAFAGLYLYQAFRPYLAYRLATSANLSNLQEAVRIEPSNAAYRNLLGRYRAASGEDLASSISSYRMAVQLDPYMAQYWLDLAVACQVAGNMVEQNDVVDHAVRAEPTSTDIAWEAANFYLVAGNLEKALREFRMVLANDPDHADSVFELSWRATGNAGLMLDQEIPPKLDVYLSFLQFVTRKQQLNAAQEVWNRLITLKQGFPPRRAFPYFTLLLAKHGVPPAKNAWQQLANLDPEIRPYLPAADNLIVNGGFEQPLLNGGFDWWFQPETSTTVALDAKEFYHGTQSLSVIFDGQGVPDAGLLQFIPVNPNTDYEFSGAYKTQDIESANGPRFSLSDPYTNESYFLSDDWLGTAPWKLVTGTFRTGPKMDLLLLKIVRSPAAGLIRGKLWIDDLKLIPK